MEIFRTESETLFETYQQTEVHETGNRHNILSAPPIYTMTPELLTRILKRANVPPKDLDKLLHHAMSQRRLVENTMEHAMIFDD